MYLLLVGIARLWGYQNQKCTDRAIISLIKVEIVNYKTKEQLHVPKDQQIIVENTHEAIISRKDYEQVNAMISARHTQSTYTHENLFRGILFCAECGHTLSLAHKPLKDGSSRGYFRCMYHYRWPEECQKPHAIYYDVLYDVVLIQIRETARSLQNDDAFFALVNRHVKQEASPKRNAQNQAKLEKRQVELSRPLRKLFEDNASGLLSDEYYADMLKVYQDEQAEIIEKLKNIRVEINKAGDYRSNAEMLREAIREYLDIEELTSFILNKLVEKIEVGHRSVVDGQPQQDVTIVWRFAGVI